MGLVLEISYLKIYLASPNRETSVLSKQRAKLGLTARLEKGQGSARLEGWGSTRLAAQTGAARGADRRGSAQYRGYARAARTRALLGSRVHAAWVPGRRHAARAGLRVTERELRPGRVFAQRGVGFRIQTNASAALRRIEAARRGWAYEHRRWSRGWLADAASTAQHLIEETRRGSAALPRIEAAR
ncbi:hypothetical protein E5676_scaffold607G00530 [Cucumis melo var. makuwa]|uniref:Uncharacterized protein n=1 Tax=Cucumis melo var. makuwa TaxID=1194695 RepID=A0A5D3D4M0_CUCMM|nr:hypothetical protein E5676_scaffold607G00530 [Cucumis melo var. makuwa]